MFDTLIESKHKAMRTQPFGTGLLSLVVHALLIAGLACATLEAAQTDIIIPIETPVPYIVSPQRPPDQPPLQVGVPRTEPPSVVVQTDITTGIPPVDLTDRINPEDFRRVGGERRLASGITPTGGDPLSVDLVQEKPEMLSHPPLVYPELLKQAGIEGTVIVQAIVDTTGRIEANSIRILASPNPGFDQSAKTLVLRALYRPARVYGRAVRVLIQQPIAFAIQRNR